MEEILHQLRLVVYIQIYPNIYTSVLYIPGGDRRISSIIRYSHPLLPTFQPSPLRFRPAIGRPGNIRKCCCHR